jgi:hypothetical protein
MKITDLLTEAKKPTPPKTRSPAAASLANRKYQQKIIPNKKKKTDAKHKKTVGMDENLDPGEYDMEGDSVKTNLHTIVRACKQLNSALGDDQNLPEWVQDKVAQAKGMMVSVTEYMLSTGEREPDMNEQRSLAEPRIVTVGDDTQGLNDFRVVGPNHLSIYPFPAKQWNNEQHQARAKGYQLQYVGNDPAKAKAAAWPGETPKSRPMAVKEANSPAQQAAIAIAKKKKKVVDEARKSAWEKMSTPFKGTSKDLDKSNNRSQDALQGLKKSAKDYQNVVDKDKKTNEGTKQKGVDGKACWDGYKRMGTKKKGGKTVDNCVPTGK